VRIAHLTSAHPRDDVRVFLKECRSLVREGHEVWLVVADGRGNSVVDGVNVVDVGRPAGRLERMARVPRRILRSVLDLGVDACHLHDPELLTIALRLKRYGMKVIYDAHEDVPRQILSKHYLHRGVRSGIANLAEFYEDFVVRRIDGVIAATPTIAQRYQAIHKNCQDVNNYPLLEEFVDLESDLTKLKEVCYVGGIAGIRGIREMVRAIDLCASGAGLNLVGGFSESATESEVKAYPGWRRVRHQGVVGREGVRASLATSVAGLVTLHPTLNYLESLPIKMFEYMAAGIPVIASNFPLWRSIVEGNQCGLCVDPLDASDIARAIDWLVDNPDEASRMGRNGRRAVLDTFNWGREQEKLRNFYRRLELETT
jgi:glycosyltransferase involved in cell wall biosynthesis